MRKALVSPATVEASEAEVEFLAAAEKAAAEKAAANKAAAEKAAPEKAAVSVRCPKWGPRRWWPHTIRNSFSSE